MRDTPLVDVRGLPQIFHNCRVKTFPDGGTEILVADRAVFRETGWEESDDKARRRDIETRKARDAWEDLVDPLEAVELDDSALWRWESRETDRERDNLYRAKRRAKGAVRDIALSNDFRFFVTLTLDGEKVNRYDEREITRKLNNWLDNNVRRRGLAYVLVAERHKDGAVHFHGFFNDALKAVDSGTVIPPEGGKPRKPRSARQRTAWLEAGGHLVYNLPQWTMGFTTAIELYGDRHRAVGYVCKYISKESGKVGGRWYYSGGDLKRPTVRWTDVAFEEVSALEGAYVFEIPAADCRMARVFVDGS